jgi:hypothetical protein
MEMCWAAPPPKSTLQIWSRNVLDCAATKSRDCAASDKADEHCSLNKSVLGRTPPQPGSSGQAGVMPNWHCQCHQILRFNWTCERRIARLLMSVTRLALIGPDAPASILHWSQVLILPCLTMTRK